MNFFFVENGKKNKHRKWKKKEEIGEIDRRKADEKKIGEKITRRIKKKKAKNYKILKIFRKNKI